LIFFKAVHFKDYSKTTYASHKSNRSPVFIHVMTKLMWK